MRGLPEQTSHLLSRWFGTAILGWMGGGMYWLFTDETNVTEKEGDFFIYGGLIMNAEQMVDLNKEVIRIRQKYGYTDTDRFKFQTASRPKQVTPADFAAAKGEALAALETFGAVVVMYVVLHDIARNKTVQEMTEWALNALIAHFDLRFLSQKNEIGAVCIDRLDPKWGYKYMQTMFADGIAVDGRQIKMERIVHYSMSCDGASHMSSLTDIALGSMRYAVNFVGGKGREGVARDLMVPLARAMWHKKVKVNGKDEHQVGGYGFLKYPRTEIRVAHYRQKYDDLLETLTGLSSTTDDEEPES